MRPLSQVDPWNGCTVCRRQAELGVMPCHSWTHELRMWWHDKVPAWTRGSKPGREIPESSAVGTSGMAIGLAGIALALAPLAEKYRPSTVKEASDAR